MVNSFFGSFPGFAQIPPGNANTYMLMGNVNASNAFANRS